MVSKGKLRPVSPPNGRVSHPQTPANPDNYPAITGVGVAKKAEDGKNTYHKGDLWIAPSLSFKQKGHQSDWSLQRGEPGESNKYLQLADIALGLAPVKHRTNRTKRSA